MSPGAILLTCGIRAYQWVLRPVLGRNCRFHPTCSDYAIKALQTHGAWHGTAIATLRILRCNPWCDGGFDPVPCACSNRFKAI